MIIGFGLVLVFMLFYYRFFGLFANIALTANVVILVPVMALLSATLTLARYCRYRPHGWYGG